MLLPVKNAITYGPVRSRRLGRSLGVNILPPGRKTCNFECLYCQYGPVRSSSSAGGAAERFPDPKEVLEAVDAALGALAEPPAFITLSGNGEPTLHPLLGEIVSGLVDLRNRRAPAEVAAWIERVVAIRPSSVQIYTLDRESPCNLISRVARESLEEIQARLEARGVPSAVFS
jgi:hypothetical protein